MDKTNVKVYFSIFGDELPIDYVSDILSLEPTYTHTKGDVIVRQSSSFIEYKGDVGYRKECVWQLGTEYEESYDVDDQLFKIINKLKGKEVLINEICQKFILQCKFEIVIIINDGETPGLGFNQDVIELANKINATIDIDLYANPYKSDLEDYLIAT